MPLKAGQNSYRVLPGNQGKEIVPYHEESVCILSPFIQKGDYSAGKIAGTLLPCDEAGEKSTFKICKIQEIGFHKLYS